MIGTAARTSSRLVTDNGTPPECCALTMNFHSDRSPAKAIPFRKIPAEGLGGSGGVAPSLHDVRSLWQLGLRYRRRIRIIGHM